MASGSLPVGTPHAACPPTSLPTVPESPTAGRVRILIDAGHEKNSLAHPPGAHRSITLSEATVNNRPATKPPTTSPCHMHQAAHHLIGTLFDASADSFGLAQFVSQNDYAVAEAFADTAALLLVSEQNVGVTHRSLMATASLTGTDFWGWCPNHVSRTAGLSLIADESLFELLSMYVRTQWSTLMHGAELIRVCDTLIESMK